MGDDGGGREVAGGSEREDYDKRRISGDVWIQAAGCCAGAGAWRGG